MRNFDPRYDAAIAVFASLSGRSADTVRVLSRVLDMADAPLSQFARRFDYWADALEIPDCAGGLAVIGMKFALHRQRFTRTYWRCWSAWRAPTRRRGRSSALGLRQEYERLRLAISLSKRKGEEEPMKKSELERLSNAEVERAWKEHEAMKAEEHAAAAGRRVTPFSGLDRSGFPPREQLASFE